MSEVAIQVDRLSKSYQIATGGEKKPYRTLQEDLLALPRRVLKGGVSGVGPKKTLWALNDLSFDVHEGEVLGVIGRNGAGKSTLLKVLARITEPTKGQAEIYGRIGSLLEVGTGFHPELTGRENVFLSGAILGMRREEITRRFDEIIEFAGVQQFTEVPVKRYSSGMYMRLAFAVAAHLETEILIVDEVLAVGDAEFQRKCLGKMDAVAQSGKTVLFVSHNIGAVRTLCHTAIWLESGKIKDAGPAEATTSHYLGAVDYTDPTGVIPDSQHVRGNGDVRIERVTLSDSKRQPRNAFVIDECFRLEMSYSVRRAIRGTFWAAVSSADNVTVLSSFQKDVERSIDIDVDGTIEMDVTDVTFVPGTYYVSIGILGELRELVDWVEQAARFEILAQHLDGSPADQRIGVISKKFAWRRVS